MYNIYYCDNCDSFHYDNKSFETLEEAKLFCENEVKGDAPYNTSDTPDINNHYHLEVYDGEPIVLCEEGPGGEWREPVYRTGEYYKDLA